MNESINVTAMNDDALFKKIEQILFDLPSLWGDEFLDNLNRCDLIYFELLSRNLNDSQSDRLENLDERKENLIDQITGQLEEKLDKNLKENAETDIGSDIGKKRFCQLNEQWRQLSDFQSKLLDYSIFSLKKRIEITSINFQKLKESGTIDALLSGKLSIEIDEEE